MTQQPNTLPRIGSSARLSNQRIDKFHEDGLIVVPEVFNARMIAAMRIDMARLTSVECDSVLKGTSATNVYRAHEVDGPTGLSIFSRVAPLP